MSHIPREPAFDSTVALMRAPYRFIAKRCRRYDSDVFEVRLLLQRTLCMSGPDASQLFYDADRFERKKAMPTAIVKTLLGKGAVHGLDGIEHRHRKEILMRLMTSERISQLVEIAASQWQLAAERWVKQDQVVLYDASCEVLTRAVCTWAGVPIDERRIDRRTRMLRLLFDGAGAVGLRHLRSRFARQQANRWAVNLIEAVRTRHLDPPDQTAARVIAEHRDDRGELLPPDVAAVALLNILRPTVAVAVYVTLIAHALHEHSDCRQRIAADETNYTESFVHEVRRHYPFFPAVAARVRQDFKWQGYRFPKGRRVLLDLYGTNHDPRTWDAPERFRPDRFSQRQSNCFDFIPQGGGDHCAHHRCAGEWITIALMKGAAEFLVRGVKYDVPRQDLRIDYARLPALPHSKFKIDNISLQTTVIDRESPSDCD
ncbi:cytochrome P450 [Rhodopirellula bahusiensis]|uniref:cytochrome P450 n=1 Tax=Rhodopirellula bahusiensis TaxID=2014065 RepID=UPI003266DEEA